jgi:hypothetical protein
MNFRITGDNLPVFVIESFGAIANKSLLRVDKLKYLPKKNKITIPFVRFDIIEKSFFSGIRHKKEPIHCNLTIRNVTDCEITNTDELKEITILFGLGFKEGNIFLSSAEENKGNPCFELTCKVSEIDIEYNDK